MARQQVGSDQGGVPSGIRRRGSPIRPRCRDHRALRRPAVPHQPAGAARSVERRGRLRARVAQGRDELPRRSPVRLDTRALSRHGSAPVHAAAGRPSRHPRCALRPPSRGGAGTEVLERSIADDADECDRRAVGAAVQRRRRRHGARQCGVARGHAAAWVDSLGANGDGDTQELSRRGRAALRRCNDGTRDGNSKRSRAAPGCSTNSARIRTR